MIKSPVAAEALLNCLKSSDKIIRYNSVIALAEIGCKKADSEPVKDPMAVNSDLLNFFKVSEKEEKDNSLIPESPQIKDYNKNKSLSEFSIGGSLRSMK